MKYLSGKKEEEAIGWMMEAAEDARKALCLRAKCGSIIVKESEIIGRGYNAPPLDNDENSMCQKEIGTGKPGYDRTCCVHAEWRAIMNALKNDSEKTKESKLYFTRVDDKGEILKSGKPFCTVCSRMALDSGISHFVLWHEAGIYEYPVAEYNKISYLYGY